MELTVNALMMIVGIVTLIVSIVAAYFAWRSNMPQRWLKSQERFIKIRKYLSDNRLYLAQIALKYYPESVLKGTPLIHKDWVPKVPLLLDKIKLDLDRNSSYQEDYNSCWSRQLKKLWLPHSKGGIRYEKYTEAIKELNKPLLFDDRDSYRLLNVEKKDDTYLLKFGRGKYFDYLNTGEVLCFEMAEMIEAKKVDFGQIRFPKKPQYRKKLDPFNFQNRCVIPGINTLTIRKENSQYTFFMHERSKEKIASAMGTYHVAPAGEFQPSNTSPSDYEPDFDPWRNIMREYNEEFLGAEEAYGRTIDYENEEPYSSLNSARKSGKLKVYYLGFTLDPLSLKGEILTACVFDAATFYKIFGDKIKEDTVEGKLFVGENNVGKPFTENEVSKYINNNKTLPAGIGCLMLAWNNRAILLS